ncbi:MAG: DMT family transporter [Methylocystaceae bacterium]|nr:DMT family transporter [Methylocystaceae bacterium]
MSSLSRGILLMALGIAFMSMMDGVIKHLTNTISAPQVLFFRAFFGLIPILIIARTKGGFKGLKTKRPFVHLFRVVLGGSAFICFTLGVREMSLANALAIALSAPFFMVLYSRVLLGENIGIHRIGAMMVGFIGVVIVLQPNEGIIGTGAPYMLFVAAAYGLSQVIARKYAASESAASFSIWTAGGMAFFGACLLPFYWEPLTGEILLWCLGMGILGGLGHYYMTEAVRLAPTVVVSPMEYTALIWGAAFDWMFWTVIPQYATVVGSSVIIASGIYILWREQLHKKQHIQEFTV